MADSNRRISLVEAVSGEPYMGVSLTHVNVIFEDGEYEGVFALSENEPFKESDYIGRTVEEVLVEVYGWPSA